ncbi:MAG: HEPN domain-containing protein, partial [Candidatus Methanomethyliales bacterium]|nr:HEPN domain-containing protein [Candidatus Methanomethylicales archaeon]
MTDKKRLIDVSERDWLDYAEADLDTAKLLYKKGKFYEIIGNDKKSKVFYNYSLYHLQQSVEKASKAIFRQMAIIFSGMRSLISNDFGKFREVDPYIKNLLNLKPSQIGHKPYSALEEIGKFIKLYKEGEGLLYIESTLESICNYMKQGLNGAISDESQRAHATETIDSTIQNLDQILKETQKRLKEFDVERKNRAIPNNEELKKVIDCLNNFYNRYNLIIEETKKIASMKKIDKLLENLLPKEMMKNLSMKKIDTLIDITLRGFYLFNINFSSVSLSAFS